MGVGVAEGSEPVVVFLAGRIPQGELNVLSVNLHIGNVVLEHGRDVDLITGKQAPRKRTRQRHVCTRGGGPGDVLNGRLTSGKVPLEKTISRQVCGRAHDWSVAGGTI